MSQFKSLYSSNSFGYQILNVCSGIQSGSIKTGEVSEYLDIILNSIKTLSKIHHDW